MKIRMRVGVSGTRSGQDWPPPGGILEVDDDEGAHLCRAGLADPIAEPAKVETATMPEPEMRSGLTTDSIAVPERRGPGRPRKVPAP